MRLLLLSCLAACASTSLPERLVQRIAGLDYQDATLHTDLADGKATAVAKRVFTDGGVELSMQATGDMTPTMRGYVYDALIAAAYGLEATRDTALVERMIARDGGLKRGRRAFVEAASGVSITVVAPRQLGG